MRFEGAVIDAQHFRFAGAKFKGTTLDFSEARIDGELDFGDFSAVDPPTGVILPDP